MVLWNDLWKISYGPTSTFTEGGTVPVPSTSQEDLEKVAARFLSASVAFYQFYTDFVALYDAISFSHSLFGRLLLASDIYAICA
jgi:RNA polymerase II-associated protein 1